eukprot:scaffold1430_cov318-Prasinococcus_capsulatus_cf.AAC.1
MTICLAPDRPAASETWMPEMMGGRLPRSKASSMASTDRTWRRSRVPSRQALVSVGRGRASSAASAHLLLGVGTGGLGSCVPAAWFRREWD